MNKMKYPKTLHLPFSESVTSDDRRCESDWWEFLKGKELVLTEKLDGSQSCIMKTGVFARSHATPTTNAWDINLIERGGVYDQVKSFLTENEGIYGENMYGIHSIEYNKLPTYFFMFAARDDKFWYSWKEVEELAEMLNLYTVPVLEKRVFESPEDLEKTILNYMTKDSRYGDTIEGVVVRNVASFPLEDFSKNVVKYVRKNHVQTNEHWKRNWKRAKLIYEIKHE